MRSFFYLILLFLLVPQASVWAQQFSVVEETELYTVYELTNPEGLITPPFEVTAPVTGGSVGYEILDQQIVSIENTLPDSKIKALDISESSSGLVEILNIGLFRGNKVATVRLNVARYNDQSVAITEKLIVKIPKVPASPPRLSVAKAKAAGDHPLSTGDWYKLSIPKQGIYQLTYSYLQNLGISVDNIDPRRIQIWGTDGKMLPELNNEERSEFSEFPIIVEGENDGSFDNADRVLFVGHSAHSISRTGSNFLHEINPYTDSTYVFLTVGDENGERLTSYTPSAAATQTISTFEDYVWKEEELHKAEDRQKTGREWLGQNIPATAQNQFVSVFRDTIPGILANAELRVSARAFARSLTRTSYQWQLNGSSLYSNSIGNVISYTSYSGDAAKSTTFSNQPISPEIEDGILDLTVQMTGGDSGANAYIGYIRMVIPRSLTAKNGALFFTPPYHINEVETVNYQLSGFSSTPMVVDIKDPMQPVLLNTTSTGNTYSVTYDNNLDNRIIAQSNFYTPASAKKIVNQNLHGLTNYPNYIVVTADYFETYATELAQHRAQNGLTPIVVTQDQILNEFSGGAADPSAIRDYLKFLWDRAISAGEQLPEYLLLFGDATYDTKGITTSGQTNYVLTWESEESENRITSYGTDDYFGFMDDNEGLFRSGDRIDLGVGRIPAQSRTEARIALDKIYTYENPENNGEWQTLVTFAGDDNFPKESERDLHVYNADGTADRMNVVDAGLRFKKIYLFDYEAEITGAGRQFPEATKELLNTINNGSLVVNYSGHGNTTTLSDEEFFHVDYIPNLTNSNRLSVFVTATCQFGRYDDTADQSGAEKLYFAENGGVITAFTTTRVVYTDSNTNGDNNFGLNVQLSQKMLERDSEGKPLRFGDIYLRTKNTSSGASSNSRRFILLGDPALRIALPAQPVSITSINNANIVDSDTTLTIKALDMVTINGEVQSYDGAIDPAYNGEITITLLDAKRTISLPQEYDWVDEENCYMYAGTSRECTYEIENDILFKGKAQVTNGVFTIEFVLPKDISFSPDNGRILMYAKSESATAGDSFTNVIFNGLNENAVNDGSGPELDVYLNDDTFFNGDLSGNSPRLIVELTDSSGINTTGTGVGHEITATIDTQPIQTFVLNDYFEGTLNDFSSGRIEYPLDELPQGSYSLKVRAWDVHNNASEENIFFDVAESDELVVDKVYNYPNPMNNHTAFTFEHNQQGNPLDVDIRIYTLSGKPVQHIQEYITTTSSYASISWNGRDRDYDRLGNGTYIYVLRVAADTPEGRQSTEKIEKLVIIR